MARTPAAPAAPSTAKELKDTAVEVGRQAARLAGRQPVQGRHAGAGVPQVRLRRVRRAPRADPRGTHRRGLRRGHRSPRRSRTATSTPAHGCSGCRRRPAGPTSPRTPRARREQVHRRARRRRHGPAHGGEQVAGGHAAAVFNRDSVDSAASAELIDLLNSARFTGAGATKARDLLGEVYEYFLEKFARAEGKRGGEFYTPAGVVRVLVEVLRPDVGPRLRPVLRLRRHVRADREVPRRAPPRRPAASPSTARSSTSAPGGWRR